MVKTLRVMRTEYGDQSIEFNTEDAEATQKAEAEFNRLLKKEGFTAYVKNPDRNQPDKKITNFADTGEETILASKYAGG